MPSVRTHLIATCLSSRQSDTTWHRGPEEGGPVQANAPIERLLMECAWMGWGGRICTRVRTCLHYMLDHAPCADARCITPRATHPHLHPQGTADLCTYTLDKQGPFDRLVPWEATLANTNASLDVLQGTVDLSKYTLDNYMRIVTYKTAYYTFYLPVACGMILAGITEEATFKTAEKILVEMGQYFQVSGSGDCDKTDGWEREARVSVGMGHIFQSFSLCPTHRRFDPT